MDSRDAPHVKRVLDEYAAKRAFTATPEPPPAPAPARNGPLLFVVQKHAAQRLHYDLRLELDGVLKSWAVPKGPPASPSDKRMAVEVEDHPFDYASFEGVIPRGQYGAGEVIVWDCGVYSPDEDGQYAFADRAQAQERVRRELAQGKLSLSLRGEKLKGSFALVRTRTPKQWLLIRHRDRFADDPDLLARGRSVLSGLSLDEVEASADLPRLEAARLAPSGPSEAMPMRLAPMLAETGEALRSDPDWLYEPKLDGYRTLAFVRCGRVELRSRGGLDLTAMFPEITDDLGVPENDAAVLDGEIVVLGEDGKPSFNALQNRAQLKEPREIALARRTAPAVLICFDLLHFAGVNLRGASYVERHRYLAQVLLPSAHVQLVHVDADAESLYAAATASGFEGIVAKRKSATYQPGKRTGAWRKFKSTRTAEFVVGGYTTGKGERAPLGALLLGYWARDALRYAGHVGSGLSGQSVELLRRRLATLARPRSPFGSEVPLHRPTSWVEPRLVVEVSFAGWTPDALLRAPVFVRLRDELDPAKITQGPPAAATRGAVATDSTGGPANCDARPELIQTVLQQLEVRADRLDLEVGDVRIRLTHLDRIYWPAERGSRRPAVVKRDLIRYLARVSPFMLPHLRDRPLTMIRMPEGIAGERFFQKHWEASLPEFVETVTVYSEHKSHRHRYLLANNLPTLLWLAQNGTLEFHVWHSRAQLGPDAAVRSTDYADSLAALESSVLNYPDYLVFDIDPYIYSGKEARGEEPELNPRGFAVGRRVAFWLRALLKEMSLDAIVKTSGKTGLHVFVPIERTVTFDDARQICETVGRHLMRSHPKEITLEWKVERRTDRIFIDYNMNVRGKTLNVAYSPRGLPGAPVSMPLTWEELEAAEVMDFTLQSVPPRLEKAGDRWHDALAKKFSLSLAFGRGQDDPGRSA